MRRLEAERKGRQDDKSASGQRVNSCMDGRFGFERHTIHGLNRMRVRAGLALAVILGLAPSGACMGRPERMRSLVHPRAA